VKEAEMAQQINIRVPESLREDTKRAAEAEGVSLNQFCALAIARAVGDWEARRFFQQRAAGMSPREARSRMGALLEKVPD
jgi:uncharacterized protein (DUF1778 family)